MRRPPRNDRTAPPETDEPRVNRRIRVPRVLLIDETGKRLGEFLTADALQLAQERGLDLIEVAPEARPPVCKIADYGQMKYDKKKKDAIARRKQVHVELKEVKLRPKTDTHDYEVKLRQTRRFLDEGNKVKITVRFRGREMAHRDIGVERCLEMAEAVKDIGVVEARPKMEGRQMFMIIASLKKKVVKEKVFRERPPREDGEEGEE